MTVKTLSYHEISDNINHKVKVLSLLFLWFIRYVNICVNNRDLLIEYWQDDEIECNMLIQHINVSKKCHSICQLFCFILLYQNYSMFFQVWCYSN